MAMPRRLPGAVTSLSLRARDGVQPALLPRAARILAAGLLASWALASAPSAARPWLAAVCAVAPALLLAFGDRFPMAALGAPFVALVVLSSLAGYTGADDPYVVMLAWASYGVGRHARPDRQPWAAAGALLLLSLNVFDDEAMLPGQVVFPTLFTAVPWILGLLLQLSGQRAERAASEARELVAQRDDQVRAAAEAERLRIARELHDVAAHSLSVVSLQAQLARRKAEAGHPPDVETLSGIESAAAEALTALRGVVSALRPPDGATELAPMPGVELLPALLDQVRTSGHDVVLSEEGQPRLLDPAADLAIYRLVQEALTNARLHGGNGTIAVALTWSPRDVSVTVTNPITKVAAVSTGTGHGVIGMRERVHLLGGQFHAGPNDSQWLVTACLPVDPVPARP